MNPWTELYDKKDEYWIVTLNNNGMFHVNSVISSNSFTKNDIALAKKYITYYINKIKNIEIILR